MVSELLCVEVAAANLDAAVGSALEKLNCTRAEVDIEVLQMHSRGLLGLFGKRQARVLVKLHDRGVIARQLARQIIQLSGFVAAVTLNVSSKRIDLILSGDDPGRLIGKHGQALDAMQVLVSTMTDRATTDRTPIVLDVDGYRARRKDFLHSLARRMTREVRQTGKPAKTPPLSLDERRILHAIFKQETGLEAYSKKQEADRKVVVLQSRG